MSIEASKKDFEKALGDMNRSVSLAYKAMEVVAMEYEYLKGYLESVVCERDSLKAEINRMKDNDM